MGTKKIVDAERLNGAMTASADAIRAKTGGTAEIPWDMDTGFAGAIGTIPTGGSDPVIQPLSVTANGTYTAPEGVDGYSPVTVNVPSSGGGGDGSETLWDRPYATGSFTLAEDTSTSYEIGDFTEWLSRTSDDGTIVEENYNLVAFLWCDKSPREEDTNSLFCGAYQTISRGGSLTAGSCGYGKGTGYAAIKNGGIYARQGIVEVRFTTTYLGYAGETYHWLITKFRT